MSSILTPDAASEATRVEQLRAVASVLGSIEAAHRWPRDEEEARRRFLAVCQRRSFADGVFYKFDRGGKAVNGPNVGFAREAARCWGNVESGTAELARRADESEMMAYAVDLQTNYAERASFISPHRGYADSVKFEDDKVTPKPPRALLVPRDVREQNQSVAARALRGVIFSILPSWYIAEAVAMCHKTINAASADVPLEDLRRQCVEWFESEFGVRRSQLEQKIGVTMDAWLRVDLAILRQSGTKILHGEATAEDEFGRFENVPGRPPSSVDLMNALNRGTPDAEPVDADVVDTDEDVVRSAPRASINGLFARLGELGLAGRTDAIRNRRLDVLSHLVGRPVESANTLTVAEVDAARLRLAEATPEDVAAMPGPQDEPPQDEPEPEQ